MKKKTYEAIVRAIEFAGCVLITLASITFALLACVAFVSIFTGDGFWGLFGLIANAVVSATLWRIRKDALV